MPQAVPVTYAKFCKLEKELRAMGFAEIYRREMAVIRKAYGLVPPREIRSGEIGFKYSAHGHTVKVWTSCLRSAVEKCRRAKSSFCVDDVIVSRPAGEDMGWVLIIDSQGRAQYFARPVVRTKGFVLTLLRRTWITRWKILNRPLCPMCGSFMVICSTAYGGNYWGCYKRRAHPHGQPAFAPWDADLPPKALKFAKAWRKQYYRYLKAERKKGNDPRRASAIRTPWRSTRNPH